jgi:hypothetical protein
VTIVSAHGGLAMLLSRRIDALSTRAGQLGLPSQCLVAASTSSKSALGHRHGGAGHHSDHRRIAMRHGGIHHGSTVVSRRLSLTEKAILLTGASGVVGSALLRHFHAHPVITLSHRKPCPARGPSAATSHTPGSASRHPTTTT